MADRNAAASGTSPGLWVAFVVPVVAWILHLSASFLYSAYGCTGNPALWLNGMTTAALVLSAAATVAGWKVLTSSSSVHAGSGLAKGAVISGCTFILAITVAGFSNVLLELCR